MSIAIWLTSCIGSLLIGIFVAIVERLRITPYKTKIRWSKNVTSPLGPIIASNKIAAGRVESKMRHTLTSHRISKPNIEILQGITAPLAAVQAPVTEGYSLDKIEQELSKR